MEKKRNTEHEPSSIFFQKSSALPDDTIFYAIFPDSCIDSKTLNTELTSHLQTLDSQILNFISPYTTEYIWQHETFNLSLSPVPPSCLCSTSSSPVDEIPHLHGKLRFGDNLEDEWFVVYLLFEISRQFPYLSIRTWDTDGEFLLIEAAFHLPRWINPDNSTNRVFIRGCDLHIVPKKRFSDPKLIDSLSFLVNSSKESRASDEVQVAVKNRIMEYPERARKNVHRVRARVPVSVAQVLKHQPCLISLAVEAFYDRDIDTMKHAAKMEKFLSKGSGEELVLVEVKMSRAMYAQLTQQTFQAPKCYPLPPRSDVTSYMEAELGMKIACGFEMMYKSRLNGGVEGKGSTWDVYMESLEKSGHFEGLLPGSKEYRRLMENAKEDFKNSSLFTRVSEMMNAPVRYIDEILDLQHLAEDFKGVDVPPSDSDSWLHDGEDELNSALFERQKEMELYDMKHNKKKGKEEEEKQHTGPSTSKKDDFDLGNIAKTMQAFVQKVSSYEGAEVPKNRNLEEVDLDVDQFMKDMESAFKNSNHEDIFEDDDFNEGYSSDMVSEESEDGSDIAESSEQNEDTFMASYSDALNEELKATTLKKSFVRANEQSCDDNKGAASNATDDMDEDFTPVDVDVNLVKSFLDSFSSQQGLPGPASNLLGIMGVNLPQDSSKDK